MAKIRRMISLCLVLCLFVTVLPLQALAADTTETTTEGGITTTVETTTTTTTDENGNTTVTIVIDTTKTGTDESGATIDYKETQTDSTVTETKEDGTVITTESSETVGSETKEWDEIPEDLELSEEIDTDVEVELIPGETTTGSVNETVTETLEDGTEVTVTVNKEVSAETSEIETEILENEFDLDALSPEDYEGKHWNNAEGLLHGGFVGGTTEKPDAEGYDYLLNGYIEATNATRAEYTDVIYAKDAVTGEPIVDEDGNYVIETIKLNGKYEDGLSSSPTIFTLTKTNDDGTKSYYYGYCIDSDTEALPGSWYSVANLEDSDYYPDLESADQLRAVVTNGYWGTASGMGSMAQMQEKMAAYYGEDATVTVEDANGNPITFKVADLIGNMTEADALTATQAAIWSNANGTIETNDGKDGTVITGIYSVIKPKSNLANCDRDYDSARDALLKATYEWLMALEGIPSEEAETVINDQNYLEDMNLVVGDKIAEPDETGENDIYEAAVNFTLAFVVGENDELTMLVKYIDENGVEQTISKKLASAGSEAAGEDTILPEADGSYTISGLELSENQEFNFDLHLQGTQHLEQGVYIYQAYGGTKASQTLVGIAEGSQDVSVTASMTVSFSVDEENKVVAKREWF